MAHREYIKIGETETTETFRSVYVESFWESLVRRVKFLDKDDIPMNKYSFPRRVYWTLHFKINCQWLPRLRGQQLYRCNFTIEIPKDRSLTTRRIRKVVVE